MARRIHRRETDRALRQIAGALALVCLVLLTGCRMDGEPALHYLGDADLEHYVGRATSVASPAIQTQADDSVATLPPHTLTDRSRDAVRDITLAEAIRLSLSNSEIIRERGQFLSPTNPLLNTPEFVNSIYDPAIQEANVQFGSRGVEAALADFDTQFTTQMLWGRDEQIQNSLFGFGQEPGQTLQQDTAQFISRLEKPIATGGVFSVSHNVDYDFNTASNRLFDSVYTGSVQTEFRHPLLAGFGVDFNRTVGPVRNIGRSTQFTNGVLIARINSDMEIAEFQRAARNLVREVEDAYWNLALAYRVFHAEVVASESALATWRLVDTRFRTGASGGGAPEVAQAKDSYFDARSRAESARGDLYLRELELRRITGMPVNDGSILRPADEPLVAQFTPDWYAALSEALTSRVELRRQKWQIKSYDLQLAAAENFARPSLDFVSRYRVNGFGDRLLTGDDNDDAGTSQGLDSFYNNVLEGDQTGWDLGFEFSMPVGLRAAKSQVRWYELRLAKARAALATMEHEISFELAAAFQEVDRYYKIAQTNLNRRIAAEERLRAFEVRFKQGGISGAEGSGEGTAYLDLLLRSQISLAQAEIAYWQSIIQYNQAIADIYLRQGTLLERAGVTISEGSWEPRAYEQALRKAWARSHAFPNPLLDAAPEPFVLPGEVSPTAIPQLPEDLLLPMPERTPPPPAPQADVAPPTPAQASAPVPKPAEAPTADGVALASQAEPADSTPVNPRSHANKVPIIRGINR